MSKTDAMRWHDWRSTKGRPFRTTRRCACGRKFMPDIPYQENCRRCAGRAEQLEKAPVTAAEADHQRLLRLLEKALADDARHRPIPLALPPSANERLRRRAERTVARIEVPAAPGAAAGRFSAPPQWAPVARKKVLAGTPLRKIAKMLDVSVDDVRLWGAATIDELRYRAACDGKLQEKPAPEEPKGEVPWCWATHRSRCPECGVGIFPRDRIVLVNDDWVHAACAAGAGFTVIGKSGEHLAPEELAARKKGRA